MLVPGNPQYAQTPEAKLRATSHVLWKQLSATLYDQTGIDNGYHATGAIEVGTAGELPRIEAEVEQWQAEGVTANLLHSTDMQHVEPLLNPEMMAAYHLPDQYQIRNPRHLKALIAACQQMGVRFQTGEPVCKLHINNGHVDSVETTQNNYRAGQVCVTSGAWTASLMTRHGWPIAARPMRGQIVLLNSVGKFQLQKIVECGLRYIVPRPDGRILIGSTEEDVGFVKQNTADGVGGLLAFAQSLVPAIKQAEFERAWSGLRPKTDDGLPFLGAVPETENLYVAAGHFRSGLQMSPGTARVMRQLMLNQETDIPLDPYAIDRPLQMVN